MQSDYYCSPVKNIPGNENVYYSDVHDAITQSHIATIRGASATGVQACCTTERINALLWALAFEDGFSAYEQGGVEYLD